MRSNYFSRLRGSFWQGIRALNVTLEGSFQGTFKVLPGHGKLPFSIPSFCSRSFIESTDLNILFLQSSLQSASKRKNLSVVGAVSRTFSIPSVSGPPFQVCGYHVDNLLSGPGRFSSPISNRKAPMALSGSRALLGGFSLNTLTARRGHFMVSIDGFSVSYAHRSLHSYRKFDMSLGNNEQPDNFVVYGYFAYHVAKTSGSFDPFRGFEWKSFHGSSPASSAAGTDSGVSSDDCVRDNRHTSSADSSERKLLTDRPLKLLSGSCYLPHPDKEETGGEDAHFICTHEQAVGVADGVGGWADLGIDAGKYARELMSNSVSAVQDEPKGSIDPARVLEKAHSSTKAKGSSTACIIALTDQGLSAINLGDSGFMVVRDGCTVFRSPAQQHEFNFTYQLENGRNSDLPSSGQVFSIPVAPGDVIVAGTDGLFDNLYNNDITSVVAHAMRAGLEPQAAAQKIAALARQRAQEKDRQTPFSAAAQEAGFRYYGGKLDDITVVVSYITASLHDEKLSS